MVVGVGTHGMQKEAFHDSMMSWEIRCVSRQRAFTVTASGGTEEQEDGGEGEERRTGTQTNLLSFIQSRCRFLSDAFSSEIF